MLEQQSQNEIAEIWKLFKETDSMFKKTRMMFKETDSKFKDTDNKFKDTDSKIDRLEKIFENSAKETEALKAELREISRKADERMAYLDKLFTGQWGKLIEALVTPGIIKLFKNKGIKIHQLHQRIESFRNGDKMEVDLLLTNDEEIVDIEVKTTLKVDNVNEFLADLRLFFNFFPRYRGCRLYGAVATLKAEEDSDRYAYKQGLFVLKMGKEEMIEIVNDEKFKPKDFSLLT